MQLHVNSYGTYVHVRDKMFADNDPIRHRGRNLCRSHCIQLDAHQFANELIGKGENRKEEIP